MGEPRPVLVRYKSVVNRVAGGAMLALSLFFLFCDFGIFGVHLPICNVFFGA